MKRYVISIAIGCLLLGVGSAAAAIEFYKYDYVNDFPQNDISSKKVIIDETMDNKQMMVLSESELMTKEKDDTVEVGKIRIEVKYYDSFVKLSNDQEETGGYKVVVINTESKVNRWSQTRELIELGINNLKDKKVYNYSLFFQPQIKVYVNSVDYDAVKVRNY